MPCLLTHQDSRKYGKLIDSYCPKDLKSMYLWSREFRAALARGYTYSNVRQVHVYKTTNKMFRKMIETFYRQKVIHGKKLSEEERERFVAELLEVFGWELTEDELKVLCEDENPAMKALSKALLNTLWGKFGQKEYSTVEYVNSEMFDRLMEMHTLGQVEVEDYEVTKPGEARIRYRTMDFPNTEMSGVGKAAAKKQKKTDRLNVAIASAVTSNARLRLLEGLEAAGECMVYCDTDSIYYLRKRSAPSIFDGSGTLKQGCQMGWWEVEPFITELGVSAKKSMFAVYEPDAENKIKRKIRAKGITLTHHNSELVSCETMKEQIDAFVHGEPIKPIETNKRRFERHCDEGDYHIKIRTAQKVFQPVLDTREFLRPGSYMSYPRCHPALSECRFCK